VPLEAEAVIEVARQFLSESHAPQYEQFSAVPVGSLPRMQVPADHVLAHPHLAAGAALARRTSVWVDVISAEGLYQSIPVWFEVHAEKRVLVLDQGAAKGAGITASAARLRKRDVLALDGRPLDGQSLATGLVAARAIAPGAVLTERSATPPGAVLRGQDLLVRMRMGEVVLEYTCKAPNDAKVGQMMRVTNPASRESFWVRVVGPGLAEAI